MKQAILVFALLAASASALAQNMSSDELNRRTVQRRAVEAAVWGMPAVNYDLMLQEMLSKTAGKVNQVIYWGRPLDWKNQTLTPDPDTIYFMSFFTLKDGPIVIEVPPADASGSLNGNLVDVWQRPLEDVGLLGIDRGKGIKLIIRPSGWSQEAPAGDGVWDCDTSGGYVLFRLNMASHGKADVAKAVAYGKRIKIYPWFQGDNPPATVFTDVKDVLFDSTIRYDESFYVHLDRIVQNEFLDARDWAMIDQLRSLGIERGKPFSPDAATKQALADGIREAHAWLEAKYDAGFEAFFYDTHWTFPAPADLIQAVVDNFNNRDSYSIDSRALAYHYAYIGVERSLAYHTAYVGTERPLAGRYYLISIKDKNGKSYDGSRTYRLHVPPDVPVDQYWSLTAYDRDTHALIKNVDRADRASNAAEMKKAPDGSVDLYIGPKAPPGQETNWIPTDPARRFELTFRVYGPKREFFAKKWTLPDVEKID
jgi:hypothetical protein